MLIFKVSASTIRQLRDGRSSEYQPDELLGHWQPPAEAMVLRRPGGGRQSPAWSGRVTPNPLRVAWRAREHRLLTRPPRAFLPILFLCFVGGNEGYQESSSGVCPPPVPECAGTETESPCRWRASHRGRSLSPECRGAESSLWRGARRLAAASPNITTAVSEVADTPWRLRQVRALRQGLPHRR